VTERIRFAIAIALQLVLLASIGWARFDTAQHGIEITLETAPVDPYDALAGYYVTLDYRVERDASERYAGPEGPLWLVLRDSGSAWTLEEIAHGPSAPLPDRVTVPAHAEHGTVRLQGADRFYMPETHRETIESALATARAPALVDLRVGVDGTLVVTRLRVDGQTFGDALPP